MLNTTHLIDPIPEASSTTSTSEPPSSPFSGCFEVQGFAVFGFFLDLDLALVSARATRSLASKSLPGDGDGEAVFAIFGGRGTTCEDRARLRYI